MVSFVEVLEEAIEGGGVAEVKLSGEEGFEEILSREALDGVEKGFELFVEERVDAWGAE